jgi:O-antigen ligase
MSQAAFYALWVFVFVLPWDPLANLPVLGSIPRIAGLVASAVGVLHIVARRRVRPLSWFHVFTVLFVLWSGISSFWSIDPEATRMRFVTSLQLLVLVWLIWEIAWSPERQRALLQAYVLGVCVAALATIQNYVSGAAWLNYWTVETSRYVALNQDPNELGVILALGLPMAWYLGFADPQRRMPWIWRLYLPLGITGILLTGSRGAFLTALVALAIIPWTLTQVRLRTKVALYALAFGSLMLATTFVPAATLKRIGSTRADIEAGQFGGRIFIWMAGLEVAGEHPLAGVGAGAFGAAVAPTLHSDMASHQTFLEILVEQGLVGLLLFFAMVAAVIKPVRQLPLLERRLWIIVLASLAVGSMSLHLGYRKQFWFVLGLVAAQVAVLPARRPVSPLLTGRVRPAPLNP